jgi:gliding motility-associated-like protein
LSVRRVIHFSHSATMRRQQQIIILILFLLSSALSVRAQNIQVEEAGAAPLTPENLIYNYFLGEGVQVLSVKYDGPNLSVGYFDKGKDVIGLERGIVMSTGRVKTMKNGTQMLYGVDAPGNVNADNNNNSTVVDADAAKLTKETPQNVVRYTITFKPTADTLRFRYVFASEEYPEYVCRDYNDLFGFFISGPGINGPYEKNGINIAKIPNTNLPVTINNIHLAYPINSCPAAYTQYFHSNDKSTKQPVFDGYLDAFTAEIAVQPCQVYTIKLVIADVGDKRLDSGVFLDAKSFGTNALKVDISNSTAVEGCSDGILTFNLPNKKSTDLKIPIKIVGGNASPSDYKALPQEVVIKAGQNSADLHLIANKDAATEGFETIAIEYQLNACKKDTVWLGIKDNELKQPELGADKTICDGESFNLDATVAIELPNPQTFTYSNPIDINTITSANPQDPATFAEINVTGIIPAQIQANVLQSVCVNVDHERLEDVDMYLVAPNGKFIELSTDNGGSEKKYKNTCFTPKATVNISDGTAPFSGDFLPEGNFSDFWGTGNNPINGKWKLQIVDDQAGQVGKLLSWNMTFRPIYAVNYAWSPEEGLNCSSCSKVKVTPSKSTTYKVIVSDSYGCQLEDSIKVTLGNKLSAPLVTCQEVTAKSVYFTWLPVPNANEYEVSINSGAWQGANGGAFSHKVDNLGLGQKVTIQVRAKNTNSKCGAGGADIGTAVCSTPDCLPPNFSVESIQNESCFGKKDGKVQLKAENGFLPYLYKFENQQNSVGVFVLLGANSYSATVTDAKGCSATTTFNISSPSPLAVEKFIQNAACSGVPTGQASLKIAGGTAPYEFSWMNGKKDSLLQYLAQGIYSVTIYDKKGCSSEQKIEVKNETELELSGISNDLKCYGENNGSIFTNYKGGTSPYTFSWSGTNNFTASTANINNLKSGIYNLTLSDTKGCKTSKSFVIDAPKSELLFSLSGSATVCFSEKAHAQAFATGGTLPYQFAWSHGAKIEKLDDLQAGTYTVTVSDAKGCAKKDSIKIIGLEEIKAELKVIHAACHDGKDAEAEVIKVGSGNKNLNISDLYYKWSNDIAHFKTTALQAGKDYTLTISDKLGCKITKNISINNPVSIGINVEKITNATCYESQDGQAAVTGIGGTAPYSYLWNTPTGEQKTANASNLKSGTYTVFVTDAKGCQAQKEITVKSPNKLKISFTPRNLACKEDFSGKVETFIVGGTTPYQYAWANGAKTPSIEKLSIGTYRLTVTDSQGCTVAEQTKLTEPEALSAEIQTTDLTCFGSKNGKVQIKPLGGTPPYKFSLGGSPFNGISNIVYLKANIYDIAVKDVRGCLYAATDIEIKEPDALEIELGKDTTMNFGDTIQIGFFQKEQKTNTTLSYLWNKRDSATMSCLRCPAPKIFPVGSTIYELKITDQKGCSAKDNVSVNVQFSPKIYVPTGFSPNGDGKNDVLIVHGDHDIKVLYFILFDKWGGQIAEVKNYIPDDPTGVWDGTLNGKKLPVGTYVWGMEVLYPTGQKETMKGSVQLMP